MHELVQQPNGWETEVLREDKDKGCSFFEEVKSDVSYTATIRYEEHRRNDYITVQGLVYKRNRRNDREHKSLEDAVFLTEDTFTGKECKANAAHYVERLKSSIQKQYFSPRKQKVA